MSRWIFLLLSKVLFSQTSGMRLISLILLLQKCRVSVFDFSRYWVYTRRNGDDSGEKPRCKVDAFDKISARVASLQSLKLNVFTLQGLKPAADLRMFCWKPRRCRR
ncbi:Uncharacterized protein Rs2_26660 [Raphanus sativus]|nr:Uncharacterized protein Rs2_26660 [Raphanus sativus]